MSRIKKSLAILFLTACAVLPFAFNASPAYSASPDKTVTIFQPNTSYGLNSEDVVFETPDNSIQKETSLVVEKIATNPEFDFESKIQKVYALKTLSVYTSPIDEMAKKVKTYTKGSPISSIAYNGQTNTYQVKFDSNNIGYVDGNLVTDDKNLAFKNVKGTYYINEDTSVFDYPSVFDGKAIKKLGINDEIKVTGKSDEGYYEVSLDTGETGYVKCSFAQDTKVVFENNFDWSHAYSNPTKKIPNNNNLTDIQQKIRSIAMSNSGTQPCAEGYCAAWVSGVYQAAGLGYPGGDAIDYWTQWSSSGDTSVLNIPVGAAVIGSGSSSSAGMRYGHVGIYIGDTDGDGEGEVAENIGYFAITPLSKWISWQTTPVYPSYGGTYGPGFIGWSWPYGKPLN